MKKNIYVFIAILLVFPIITLACSCATWQPLDLQGKVIQSKYEDYSSIVLAKVEKVDKILIPEIRTDGKNIKDDGEKTRFSSIKTWKGFHKNIFHTKITSSPASCGIRFKLGETYLLFLNNSKEYNYYITSICSGNLLLNESPDYISALNDFIEQPETLLKYPEIKVMKSDNLITQYNNRINELEHEITESDRFFDYMNETPSMSRDVIVKIKQVVSNHQSELQNNIVGIKGKIIIEKKNNAKLIDRYI